jgi:WD40 repeat protein
MLAAGAGLVAHRAQGAKQPGAPSRAEKGPTKAEEGQASQPRLTDRYGDPLPAGAVRRLGTSRLRGGLTHDLAFTPDGKALASTGPGRGVCLWDARTGQEVRHLAGAEFGSLAISPDGRLLASGYEEGKVHLWELNTGRAPREVPIDGEVSGALAFSPDGTLLASCGGDNLIRLIDVAGGRVVRRLRGHQDSVWAVAFAPDGKTLASAGGLDDCAIHLWDPATGRERARLTGHNKANVHVVAFFPDGKTLASADDSRAIRLWDVGRGAEVRVLEAPRATGALAISPDGRLLASGHRDAGLIRLWDPATGRELRHWRAHFLAVDALAFAPDGKTLASGSMSLDSSVRLWDPATGRERLPFGGPQGWTAWLRFTAGGKAVLLHSRDGTVRRWDWAADREQILATGGPHYNQPRFSADGRVRALDDPRGRTITVWDDPRNAKGRILGKHRGQVYDAGWQLALSADGKLLASGGAGGEIHVWDVRASKELWEARAGQPITGLAFSPDGKALASEEQAWPGPPPNPTIRLWDVATGKAIRALPHGVPVGELIFSPDGHFLAATCRAPGPRLWDLTRGEELAQPAAKVACTACAFSPDSRLLAWSNGNLNVGDGRIHVVELASQQEVLTFPGHRGGTNQLAFAPDGRLLASAGGDSTVLIWDLTGRYRDGRFAPAELSPAGLDKLWAALAEGDAARAFRARQSLALAPPEQVVPLLRQRLRPAAVGAPQIAAWIGDLDSRDFDVREKATRGLERLGAGAEPALRRALADNPGPEPRRRLQALLRGLGPSGRGPLQKRRAIAILEQAGTPSAREALEGLSRASPRTFLNQEAKRALERLAERPAGSPD